MNPKCYIKGETSNCGSDLLALIGKRYQFCEPQYSTIQSLTTVWPLSHRAKWWLLKPQELKSWHLIKCLWPVECHLPLIAGYTSKSPQKILNASMSHFPLSICYCVIDIETYALLLFWAACVCLCDLWLPVPGSPPICRRWYMSNKSGLSGLPATRDRQWPGHLFWV